MSEWIPDDEWAIIVANVPIVSVDLVVYTDEGVLLGKRTNEPAKGEWFVPGGRVLKGETLEEAVHRVAREELGIEVVIERRLGAYEHFYEDAEIEDIGGKHYVANGFVVRRTDYDLESDDQHDTLRVFGEVPQKLHEYSRRYIEDAELPIAIPGSDDGEY